MIRVRYIDPESKQEVVTVLNATRVRLGRDASNDLVLPFLEVSRHHAELNVSGNDVQVVDRSTNGTFVNSERVHGTHPVYPTDQLTLGNIVLRVEPVTADGQSVGAPQWGQGGGQAVTTYMPPGGGAAQRLGLHRRCSPPRPCPPRR